MIKLLVIADDFTGALDTGVQFKAKGIQIRVADPADAPVLHPSDKELQVLILDAETRHMPPQQAYQTVYRIVSEAMAAGIPCIYKKTDSGLRGNIGSELSGMLDASGQSQLHFVPAFPQIGRKTIGGIHYIGDLPVADSVFGSDTFEPVRHSAVQDIIASQSTVPVHLAGPGRSCGQRGIVVYDASSDEDLSRIACQLEAQGSLSLLAGCAGFAAVLPRLLHLEQSSGNLPLLHPRLVTICGSINPITVAQLDEAERTGTLRIRITPRQKLDPEWVRRPEGAQCIDQWLRQIECQGAAIVECGVEDSESTSRCAAQAGLGLEEMRSRISQAMGDVLTALLDRGLEATLLVTGGDTLLSFLRRIEQKSLVPLRELMPGVVLSQIRYRDKDYNLISKSGGFGSLSILNELEQMIHYAQKEDLICWSNAI